MFRQGKSLHGWGAQNFLRHVLSCIEAEFRCRWMRHPICISTGTSVGFHFRCRWMRHPILISTGTSVGFHFRCRWMRHPILISTGASVGRFQTFPISPNFSCLGCETFPFSPNFSCLGCETFPFSPRRTISAKVQSISAEVRTISAKVQSISAEVASMTATSDLAIFCYETTSEQHALSASRLNLTKERHKGKMNKKKSRKIWGEGLGKQLH